MADNTIDTLNIKISSDVNRAVGSIGNLENKLKSLSSSLSRLDSGGLKNLASGVGQLSNAMRNFNSSGVKTQDFTRIATGLNKLGTVNVQGVNDASRAISTLTSNLSQIGFIKFDGKGLSDIANSISQLGRKTITQATDNIPKITASLTALVNSLNGIGKIKFDITGLANLVTSISKLGGKAATNACANIKSLGTALRQFMATLSTAPSVSQNIIQMTNALANLARNGSKVSSASRSMQNSLKGYSASAATATKSTKGLVSQIGLFYAKFFLLIRAFKQLGKAISSASDYLETLNYFDASFGQIASNSVGDWEAAGYESADAYANSFGKRAKQLTEKLSGFTIQDNGMLKESGKGLGLNPEEVLNYQATFGQLSSSMGVASETALKLSNALTMVGADIASVKNESFDKVWDNMASGIVGMSRAVDKYGINIRIANLEQKAQSLGIEKSISKMSQSEKAILRTIVILDSTKYAWADLSNTINQPANQIRLLQANFQNLSRTIGSVFVPALAAILPYINGIVIALQRLFAWIAKIIGAEAALAKMTSAIGGSKVDISGLLGEVEDTTNALDDASDSAKKLQSNLASFDKLNVISTPQKDKEKDNIDISGELDSALTDALDNYQKVWDEAFKGVENRATQFADKLQGVFQQLAVAAQPSVDALKRLWDEGLSRLGNFAWTGLINFWNEFLKPLGAWTLGTGFPMFIDSINNFLIKINWEKINGSLRELWKVLEPFAEKVGEGLLKFFDGFLAIAAPLINTILPPAIDFLAKLVKVLTPFADELGYLLGASIAINTFSKSLGLLKKIGSIGLKITGISSITKAFQTLKKVAVPIATIISTKVVPAFSTLFKSIGGSKAATSALTFMFPKISAFSASLSGVISTIGTALGAIGAVFGLAGGAAIAAGAAIVAVVVGIVAAIILNWDKIKEFFTTTIPEWWNGTVVPFFAGIPDKFGEIWDKVKEFTIEKWNSIMQWFSQLPEKIAYAIGFTAGTFVKWGQDIYNIVTIKVPEIIENIVKWFSELPGKIWTAIVTTKDKIIEWGTTTYDKFKEWIDKTIKSIVEWFSKLPENIWNAIIETKDKIIEWGSEMIDAVKSAVPKIVDNVVTFFKELPKKLKEAGTQAINGFIDGIKSKWEDLKDWVKSLADSVSEGFRDALDIHSPSRITEKIGQFFVEGFNVGISEKAKSSIDTIKSWADSMSNIQIQPNLATVSGYVPSYSIPEYAIQGFATSSFEYNGEAKENIIGIIQEMLPYIKNAIMDGMNSATINATAVLDETQAYNKIAEKERQSRSMSGKGKISGI